MKTGREPQGSGNDSMQPVMISADTDQIFAQLSSGDWSFTDDETNDFTHNLHPYPAKFIPQIPANLIKNLSLPGDLICDPFGGCGTTAVEAVRLGRRAISFDANPLSATIGRTKVGYMTPTVKADLDRLRSAVMEQSRRGITDGADSVTIQTEELNHLRPLIPNIEKWFNPKAIAELCLIKHLIGLTETPLGRDVAETALSRIITIVSNQESETRYVAVAKTTEPNQTLWAYLQSLEFVTTTIANSARELQFADARFVIGDSRQDIPTMSGTEQVDLIVTSPPYANATDYHLYHRFRMFWLGYDPRDLGKIEIGSHLRHQRNGSGFEEYRDEMALSIADCHKILAPGRYAVFVVANARFRGKEFATAEVISGIAEKAGLNFVGKIERPVHQTKRSFPNPGRRTVTEHLVILQKPNETIDVVLHPPDYRMWEHEARLRKAEIETISKNAVDPSASTGPVNLKVRQPELWALRRLAFTKSIETSSGPTTSVTTWQNWLENGYGDPTRRKNPQYATHGLHSFKGKFYPQLVKGLLNISDSPWGGRVFDPYCGSGTAPLEGMLNGFASYGCDLNPLAAKIARAKTEVLTTPRDIIDDCIAQLEESLISDERKVPKTLDEFDVASHPELVSWFSEPILFKLNRLLKAVRQLEHSTMVEFGEVVASSLIREISEQDPSDLRTRRRKVKLVDAPVVEMFRDKLSQSYLHLQQYWKVASRRPSEMITPVIVHGDSREPSTQLQLGLAPSSVDCVLTSPPFATALPYVDTDRLSLLSIMGLTRRTRSAIDIALTGSREITGKERESNEATLLSTQANRMLPEEIVSQIRQIYYANKETDVGFRRANMPALLWRYFTDIKATLEQLVTIMKPGATAFYLVGNNRTKAGDAWVTIPTANNIAKMAEMVSLRHISSEEISVTTENYRHIKNAITTNQVLRFQKV